jgi:lipopolysaccharide export system protein LptA
MKQNKKKLSYILFVLALVLTVFLSSKLSLENWFYKDNKSSEQDEFIEAANNKALLFDTKIFRVNYEDGKTISLVGEKITIDKEHLMHVKDFTLDLVNQQKQKVSIQSKEGVYDNKNSLMNIREEALLKNDKATLLADGMVVDIKNKKSYSEKKCTYKDDEVIVNTSLGFSIVEEKNYNFILNGEVEFIGQKGEKGAFYSSNITGELDKKNNKLIFMQSKNKSKMVSQDYVATSDEAEIINNSSSDNMVMVMKNNLVIKGKDGNLEAERLEYNFNTGKTKIFSSGKKRLRVKVYEK